MADAHGSLGSQEEVSPLPVFREFLYADLDRARSLIAQLAGGVPEEERGTTGASRRFNIGAASYFGYNNERRTEEYQQRSLLDALFPELEGILEAEGWLTDISDTLHDTEAQVEKLTSSIAPGSIVRLTADAQLFDSEYIARVLGGMSAAMGGIASVTTPGQTPAAGPKKHTDKRPRHAPSVSSYAESGRLEDLVEPFDSSGLDVGPNEFRGMIKTARGMFNQGLHMLISTEGGAGWTATARLQQGRRYLDAEPDVLFSRYGTTPQEWTIVGTIGHFSRQFHPGGLRDMNFLAEGGASVSRPQFVAGLNSLMSFVAGFGFADTPPYPGFSIVPVAVYRLIPKARR